jgi:hypothetical protein
MSNTLLLAAMSLAIIPVGLFADGEVVRAAAGGYFAALLAMVAVNVRADEFNNFRIWLSSVGAAFLIPAGWMLVQTLPLGMFGLGHPIWSSSSAAIDGPLWASISIDRGATLQSLGRYLSLFAFAVAICLLTIDRRRAEWMLFAIVAVAATASCLILAQAVLSTGDGQHGAPLKKPDVAAALAIGCVASVAAWRRSIERLRNRRSRKDRSLLERNLPTLTIFAFALCLISVLFRGLTHSILAAFAGLAIFASIFAVRQLRFGIWGVTAMMIVVAIFAVAAMSQISGGEGPLTWLTSSASQVVGVVSRMVGDAGWSGSGAGNFLSVAQLYRDVADPVTPVNMTTAAVIIVDLGWVAFIFVALGVVALIAFFSLAAIRRGRDAFYPAAGAASLLVLALTAFGDASALSTSTAVISLAVVALAVAQTPGRAS